MDGDGTVTEYLPFYDSPGNLALVTDTQGKLSRTPTSSHPDRPARGGASTQLAAEALAVLERLDIGHEQRKRHPAHRVRQKRRHAQGRFRGAGRLSWLVWFW